MRRFKKVIALGFDGIDPLIVAELFRHGKLPNFASLQKHGAYRHLATTSPAQTPVAWSTFATGLNPGGHGIFDFLCRDPQTYLPQLGLNRIEQKNAFLPPRLVNRRGGVTIWDRLGRAGISSTVIRCPCTYPPGSVKGRLLSGMGVPDARGSFGVSTFYTSRSDAQAGESETLIHVAGPPETTIRTKVLGPLNPKTRQPSEQDVEFRVDSTDGIVTVAVVGQSGSVTVKEGCWSPWLSVSFRLGILQTMRGMVRFYLVGTKPELEVYASPVNFDPVLPTFPISSPEEYAADLSQQIGRYYTAGMIEDHTGLNNERFDEAVYLQQCHQVWRERESMLFYELDRFRDGFLYCLFDTPDRVQHMFWRFREPDHPANRGRDVSEFAHVITEQYEECDRTLGKVLKAVDDETLLLVLSDHGFGSFRRGLHLNSWLLQHGLLHLQHPKQESNDYLRGIDWSRTKAYALGLGGIYINRAGREAEGIVSHDECETLKTQIARQLTGLVDPQESQVAVVSVKASDEVYHGPRTDEAPDLLVNFNRGYRASWETAVGATPSTLFSDNVKRWSGDHIFSPELVPGVLLSNTLLASDACGMLDLAPTVLDAFGLPPDSDLEGRSLLA